MGDEGAPLIEIDEIDCPAHSIGKLSEGGEIGVGWQSPYGEIPVRMLIGITPGHRAE